MNDTVSNGIRLDAIRSLQNNVLTSNPASDRYKDAEEALNLALAPKRKIQNAAFLIRNLLRDGRIVRRRRDRREFPLDAPADRSDEESTITVFAGPDFDPEHLLIATELTDHVLNQLADCPGSEKCLEGLVLGESAAETAVRLGVHRSRVEYVRAKIRSAARN